MVADYAEGGPKHFTHKALPLDDDVATVETKLEEDNSGMTSDDNEPLCEVDTEKMAPRSDQSTN